MKTNLLILALAIHVTFAFGQEKTHPGYNSLEELFEQQIDHDEFDGKFSLLYTSEGQYNYYVVDMTGFADHFSRAYFVNLTYVEDLIIPMNINPSREQNWFKAYYKHSHDEITAILNELKDKTSRQAGMMTEEEKSAWMSKNYKFKNQH